MKKILIVLLAITIIVLMFFFLREVFAGRLILKNYIVRIGRLEIRWYSVLIVTGIFLSYYIARKRAEKEGVNPEHLDEVLVYGIIAGVIGARIYYVVFRWDYYSKNFSEIFKIWHGGLAIHGAIIAAILTGFLYTRLKKNVSFTFLQGLDIFTGVLPLGQAIGRWGNFFNYEAFGVPTNLPWKMFVPEKFRPMEFRNQDFFHPTFLYESLWDLFVFYALTVYYRKYRKGFGEVTALYLILYSIGRFFIEGLRVDSLMLGNYRVAKIISLIFIVIGIILLIYLRSSRVEKKAS
ncbi:MAG: prolipoprotein diacylglyceryl transferase [Thermotogae bacterium]|nr:MAG: prolipoprotein diacylglyceryl transferase [Thermotogota bacterium]